MGQQQSSQESLYNEVIKGDIEAIKILHSNGATLEWLDEEGKTPLMVACSSSELLNVAKILIELGANITSFRAGGDGGTPLHYAAKADLHQTVKLLLSYGANPLLRNLSGETPLDVARTGGCFETVRAIESHICIFSGWLRESYGLSFFDTLARNILSRKIWVVILPSRLRYDPNLPLRLELVIYPTLLDSRPRTKINLWDADIKEPNLSESNPVLVIFDKSIKTRFAFTSGNDGDKQQIQCLYNSCKGIPQSPLESQPDLDSTNGWENSTDEPTLNGWGPPESKSQQGTPKYNGWGPSKSNPTEEYNGWGQSKSKSLPKKSTQKVKAEFSGWGSPESPSPETQSVISESAAVPSAPPVPEEGIGEENIIEASRSTCVVCWESPAVCACIPCGHMAVCMTCSDMIISNDKGSCPVCRAPIHQVVKIFSV